MPKSTYRPTCVTCRIRPSALGKALCHGCSEAQRVNQEALAREAAGEAAAAPPPKPKQPAKPPLLHCSACLTTLNMVRVDPQTGVAQCARCRVKHGARRGADLAASYAWSAPTVAADVDRIY